MMRKKDGKPNKIIYKQSIRCEMCGNNYADSEIINYHTVDGTVSICFNCKMEIDKIEKCSESSEDENVKTILDDVFMVY